MSFEEYSSDLNQEKGDIVIDLFSWETARFVL